MTNFLNTNDYFRSFAALKDAFPKRVNAWREDGDYYTSLDSRAVDAYTDKDGNTVYEFNVAGFNKETLTVTYTDNILKVIGQDSKRSFEWNIRVYDRGVDGIKAKVQDGILYITFLLQPERKIQITVE